jgi:hypothetical protein
MKVKFAAMLILALSSTAGSAQQMTFPYPRINNRDVGHCLSPGRDCGQPAADQFCQTQGYQRATDFRYRSTLSALLLRTKQICTIRQTWVRRRGYVYDPNCSNLHDVRCEGLIYTTVPGPTPPPAPASPYVCVAWDHANFGGASIHFRGHVTMDQYDTAQADPDWQLLGGWNDRISSIQLASGCRIIVWEHTIGRGAHTSFSQSVRYVGDGWNDRISSASCFCP